ncbi:MAG: hypothetical protein EBT13_10435 [Rhodobacteraceae bacterium]|nr:hypothetical protein [Paracoccaceae bacterium]
MTRSAICGVMICGNARATWDLVMSVFVAPLLRNGHETIKASPAKISRAGSRPSPNRICPRALIQ